MIQAEIWRRSSPLAMLTLAVCQPASPAGETDAVTAGTLGVQITTGDAFGTTERIDSGENTSAGEPFACPGARWHEGDLDVVDATDLESLRDVGGVTGSLNIGDTSMIVDLEFLSCLEVVKGTVFIHDNDSLADLHGLEELRAINQDSVDMGLYHSDFGFLRNPALQRIGSLDSLETLGTLMVQSNESLTEIEMPALRQVERLLLGGYCVAGGPQPDQPLANVGSYPVLESVGYFELYGQYQFTSLESLMEMVDRGVTFGEAAFGANYNLPQSEIEAFAAAASLTPYTCSNQDDTEECPPCPPD